MTLTLRSFFTVFFLLAALSVRALSLSLVPTSPLCVGQCNGSIQATASAGTAPYQYSIDGGATWNSTGLFTGRCAGNYTIIAKDALNVTVSATTTITPPVPLTFTASGVNCSAVSVCDGQIIINATGGTPPYTFTVAGPSGTQTYTSSPITGLCPGSYTITVTGAAPSNCPGTCNGNAAAVVSIGVGGGSTSFLVANASGSVGFCASTCNYIYATASGGIPPYQYNFGSGWQTSATSPCIWGTGTNQTFNVCVKDAYGSVACTTIVCGWPLQPFLMTTVTPAYCGGCNGTITIQNNFGPGTMYSVSSVGTQSSPTFTNLCPGMYNVTAAPPSGNICPAYGTIFIANNATLGVTTSVVNATCNGGCNGSATISVSGPGPFEYSNNGGVTWQTSNVFTALCAGTYTVQVRSTSITCTGSITFTVTQPAAFVPTTTTTALTCDGVCNGSYTTSVTPSGSYQYSNNGGVTWQASPTFTALCAGSYTVTVKNTANCQSTCSFTITQPPPIVTSVASSSNITCNGASDGAATINASGGTGTLTYNWTPGNPTGDGTSSITNLAAGTWSCTITDGNSCAHLQTVLITQPAALASSIATTNISCNGGSDGTATITASGGVPGYSYDWAPGNPTGDGTNSVSGLSAGTWSCTITDANNCTRTQTVAITQPPAVSVSIVSFNNVLCFGANDGAATIAASGGTGTLSYAWTPSGGNAASASVLAPGIYTCTINDANGCAGVQTVSITEPPALTAAVASVTDLLCNGVSTGAATISASGGTGALNYAWSPSGGNAPAATNLAAGAYTCTITDANGCSDSLAVNITQPPAIAASVLTPVDVTCYGFADGAAALTASGGTGTLTYDWTPGTPNGDGTGSIMDLIAGTWSCTITDANGCVSLQNVVITSPPEVQAVATVTAPICHGICTGSIVVGVSPIAAYQYSFDLGNTWQAGDSLGGLCDGGFNIVVKNAAGCTDTIFGANVLQPPPISFTAVETDATCYGSCDGLLLFHPDAGPSAPYSFSIDTGNTWSTDSVFSSVCAGAYTLLMRDAFNCLLTDSLIVSEPTALLTSATVVTTSCGNCDGAVTLLTSGGNGPYAYNWLNGPSTGTNLCAGNYTIVVSDLPGCTDTLVVNVAASVNVVIDSIATVGTPSSVANGTATVYPSGNGPFSFAWDAAAGNQTTQVATNLLPGIYCVTVTDANGCSQSSCDTVAVLTSVAAAFGDAAFTVFPNPFSNRLYVQASGNYRLTLFDITGKSVIDFGTVAFDGEKQLSLPDDLAAGTYFLRAENEMGVVIVKLVRE